MTLMIEHISVKAQAREGSGYRYDRSLLVTPALPRQENYQSPLSQSGMEQRG